MPEFPPLIITLSLDEASHAYFTKLRTKYFPAYCNYLDAHITLFHRLHTTERNIQETLQKLAERKIIKAEVISIKNTGKGNSFTVASEELQQLHKSMQQPFAPYLIAKDRRKLQPHITIQNKVTAFKAEETTKALLQNFKPHFIQGIGLSTWLYAKGPWIHLNDYLFIA